MVTACWQTYHGTGRLGLSPPPVGVPRGHRIYHGALFLCRPLTLHALAPDHEWAALHAAVYPAEPILMGDAPAGAPSYRVEVARWLASHIGEVIPELDTHRHWPRRVKPTHVPGLMSLLSA